MPGFKRRSFKRRSFRRRRLVRRGRLQAARKMVGSSPVTTMEKIARGVGTVASIARTVSSIASMINVEDKWVDLNMPPTGVTQAGPQGFTLNTIVQGTGVNQRIGNKILNKSVQINFSVYFDATATVTAANTMRIVLCLDKKPQISTLLWNTAYIPSSDINGLIDKNNAGDRIVVLKDQRFLLSGGNNRLITTKWFVSLARIHTQYTQASSFFEEGELRLLLISDVTGAQPALLFAGNSRFSYMDN